MLLSPAWKQTEVEHALALTDPSHAVGDHPVLAELMPMLHLDEPVTAGQRAFEPPDPDTDALFVFSSGTTGMPKAVRHTHGVVRRCGAPLARCAATCRRPTACRS